MKWALIKQHLFRPFVKRLGAMSAIAIVTLFPDVDPALVDEVGKGVMALLLIGWDFGRDYVEDKKAGR